ncbi:MAG: YaaA family protein, partial [Campylobacterales bacterium]|nr:YaaA family protein [Campylobacterales bacterium]
MKILLAPSETKSTGGTIPFSLSDLWNNELLKVRSKLTQIYLKELKDEPKSKQMFGLKKPGEIEYYRNIGLHSPAKKAVERYTGVAFDYLDYSSLDDEQQKYIDKNVMIFSNLFGPIMAGDTIPEYRLAQGAKVGEIEVDKYYHANSTKLLDEYLADEEILDIRAGYYDRFYIPSKPYTTLKFIKDGKVVSHWAKAYRGKVLREIAKAGAKSIEEFMSLPIEGLSLSEIQTRKNKTEIIYTI